MHDKARDTVLKGRYRGRDFLALRDYRPEEIRDLLDLALLIKASQESGHPVRPLEGKVLGMIFEKSSTRTRVSFEVGMIQLGGHASFLSSRDIQLGRGETIGDTARVLSRYLQGIMIRTYSHESVEELAQAADIPVINGLTDLLHPCQALADYLTIEERFGQLSGLKLTYLGDGNNVCHSLLYGGALTGVSVTAACPQGYEPLPEIVREAQAIGAKTGAQIQIVRDPRAAVEGAHVLYTDVWASMGQEEEFEARSKVLSPYQLNASLASLASPEHIVLHCLPAHRGEEVTAEVLDGPHSAIFDQAENRLHAQKAIMAATMCD